MKNKKQMKNIKTFETFEMTNSDFPDLDKASEIIGKKLDKNNALTEITYFIELNISNKDMVKQIDELTDIKRKLKI